MPVVQNNKVILFYGSDAPFSNMYICSFKDKSNIVFNCVDQYYQYNKCITNGNKLLAEQILKETSPYKQKALGGTYFNGFDSNLWNKKRFEIMFNGNMYKYQQNKELLNTLLDTKYCKLGEASVHDVYWGIGLELYDPTALLISKWSGDNQMGLILTNIRYWLSQSITTIHLRHCYKYLNFKT